MIEELFILNCRGDLLVRHRQCPLRHGQSDVREAVYHQILRHPSAPSQPRLFIRRLNTTVLCLLRGNVCLCLSYRSSCPEDEDDVERFDLLETLYRGIESVVGDMHEANLLVNRRMVQELLEESIFRGRPICDSPAGLRDLVLGSVAPSPSRTASPEESSVLSMPMLATRQVAEGEYLIVEVADAIHVHLDSLGRQISSCVEGRVEVISNLPDPFDLELSLEWNPSAFSAQTVSIFETFVCHKSVDLSYLDKNRKLKCNIRSKVVSLLSYTLIDDLKCPLQISTSIRRHRTFDLHYDIFVIIKSNFSSLLRAEIVELRLLVPDYSMDVQCDVTSAAEFAMGFTYNERAHELVHERIILLGGQDTHIRYKLRLNSQLDALSDIGPLSISYSIQGMSITNLRISSIISSHDKMAGGISSSSSEMMTKSSIRKEVKYVTSAKEMHSYV